MTRLQNRDYYHLEIMRHNNEIHLRLEYCVDVSKQYVEWLLCYGLDLHVLLLIDKPYRLSQLSYVASLVADPWRLMWVCLDRQDAASQAPLMLARRRQIGGFGHYDGPVGLTDTSQ